MHYVFDSPTDKFIFDVGHQSYVHKILTGRGNQFASLRQYKGIAGFQKRKESEHDVWEDVYKRQDQSDLLHEECARILANSLCGIGTIDIIHDDKMVAINKAFVRFIEELENRVISYSDFMQYRSAYYEDWMQRINNIFQK